MNWLFAETTHVVGSQCRLTGEWSSGGSDEFQVSSKSVQWFPMGGRSKKAHCLPVHRRVEFKIACLAHRSLA